MILYCQYFVSSENNKKRRKIMLNCIFVGLGGFVGSILRYLVGLIPIKNPSGFPINTFLINVFGSLAIGVIACLAAKNSNLDSRLILFLKVGICASPHFQHSRSKPPSLSKTAVSPSPFSTSSSVYPSAPSSPFFLNL